MNDQDKAAFKVACKDWHNKSAGKDLGEYFFEAALAHRDAQVVKVNQQMLEALESAVEVAEALANQLNSDELWTHVAILKEAMVESKMLNKTN